jgi:hypothetical protein
MVTVASVNPHDEAANANDERYARRSSEGSFIVAA